MRKETLNFRLHVDGPQLEVTEPTFSIDPDEFCRLAVSSRSLVRCDDSARGLKGLRDMETGEYWFVNDVDLQAHNVTSA